MHTKRVIQAAVVIVLSSLPLAVGCGDDSAVSKDTADAGEGDATANKTTPDAGGEASTARLEGGGAVGVGGAGDAASTTLYQRLGNHAGIRAAVDHIVQAELGDPKIASFFFNQVATPIPAGHPNVDQLSECFTDLLASAAGGPETYPTTVTDDAGSFTCRDLVTIHRPLHISGGTFDTFVMIAAGELQTLGVASSDIQTIGTVLNGTKAAIIDPNLGDAGEMGFDAGQD